MEEKIKVSIIMPFLNSIEYLKECMESVINQTLKEIEIICVDAGSTDGTLELLNEYAKNDSRIKIINSNKKSYGYQINLGLDAACGEYFGIVESDDYIKENMYFELYNIAKKFDCDIVKSDFCRFVTENNEKIYTYVPIITDKNLYNKVESPIKNLQLFNAYVLCQPGIYNMRFIRENNIRLNETPGASYQDNGLWFQVFALAKSVYLYDKAFYMLRRDNPNSSVASKGKVYCMCEEYDYIRKFLSQRKSIEKKLAPVCAYWRYRNYMFTLNRIADEYKLEFLQKFSDDFKKIDLNGELDKKIYNQQEINQLLFIINNPRKFYYTRIYEFNDKKITLEELLKQNITLNYKIDDLNRKIQNISNKNNKIIDSINNVLWYYKNYGLKFTLKKIIKKLNKC